MKKKTASRRTFLLGTVLAGRFQFRPGLRQVAAKVTTRDPDREQLERLLETYGGELGDVRRVGR